MSPQWENQEETVEWEGGKYDVYPKSDVAAMKDAAERLQAAERKCQSISLWLPPWLYRRRLDAAMKEFKLANVAMFDAQTGYKG